MGLLKPEYRTPNPDQPWGLIWREWPHLRVIRAHVANMPTLCRHYGYRILITDFDVTLSLSPGQEWRQPSPVKKPFYTGQPYGEEGHD